MANRARLQDGRFATVHGAKHTKLYNVWCAMKERCHNPHNKRWNRYGGRGIVVCEDWVNSFEAFRNWSVNHGYRLGLSIDRINSDGNYEPSNCRWVTAKEQNRNYSKNHYLTYQGRTKCVADWADELGINRSTILWRLRVGKEIEDVLSTEDGRVTRWKKTTSQN